MALKQNRYNLNNKHDNQNHEQIHAAKKAVDELRIDQWIKNMRALLLKRFGPVPHPGIERGEYFKNISESFKNSQIGMLAGKVAAEKIHEIESFTPILKKATLEKVKKLMDMLNNILEADE